MLDADLTHFTLKGTYVLYKHDNIMVVDLNRAAQRSKGKHCKYIKATNKTKQTPQET